MKASVHSYLDRHHGPLLAFWTGGASMPDVALQDHCDMVYSLVMIGEGQSISDGARGRFAQYLRRKNLPGWVAEPEFGQTIVPHNAAYAFGTLNLLSKTPGPLYDIALEGRSLAISDIVDPLSKRPIYPAKWAHHNWRVSHWIGGIPSIIVSVGRSGGQGTQPFADLIEPVRDATDGLIDKSSGLLRAYNSDLVQAMFRALYALRHDPELGDVGGVAHILWIDHVLERRYTGLESLLRQSQKLFRGHIPFMERVPYCLDFDIVQIVRTALDQSGADRSADEKRSLAMMSAIEQFFDARPGSEYSLHKVPGALATFHECALLSGTDPSVALGTTAIDIIKAANWL